MLKSLSAWFDNRTGYKALVHEALEEPIPGGARWRYVFGSALTAAFAIQLVTGVLLMFSYSPSATTAWGSVYFITYGMDGGWFVRGVHHFGAQAMIVLLAMHLLQVLWAGAYRAPREVNWWFGILLMFVTVGFSLTGYLLPWDQKGYWATGVATNIMGITPGVGPMIQKVVVGGANYGNQTLTRFYGLHVGVLPAALVVLLAGHVYLFRKHGVTPPPDAHRHPVGKFWPRQVFMDIVASLVVLAVVVGFVLAEGGANLDAPADPSGKYPARPEWYFLSLFQFLKKVPNEVVGAIVVPGAVVTVLFALPLLDKVFPRKIAHFLACAFVFGLVGAAAYLTIESIREDRRDPQFQAERAKADAARDRALQLAGDPKSGIPPEGAAYLLMRDPLAHGRGVVLEGKCLGCHYYDGKGVTTEEDGKAVMSPQTAPDLKGFGSRAWVRGLLDDPKADRYFGKVAGAGGMARWKKASKLAAKELDSVADLVALFATMPDDAEPEEWAADPKVAGHPGAAAFAKECATCHVVAGLSEGGEEAPELTGWGSTRWTSRMIQAPGSPRSYGFLGDEQVMPAFGARLTANDLTTVVRFLKGEYAPPPGAPGASAKGKSRSELADSEK